MLRAIGVDLFDEIILFICVSLVLVPCRERSSGGGGGSQQLVTVGEAGRMLAPLVAQEVEKETKKIEIRMKVRARVRILPQYCLKKVVLNQYCMQK